MQWIRLHAWEELGSVQIRVLMEVLADLNYQHLKQLKLWKARISDQGVRCICKYIMKSNTIQIFDVLDNQITALGCQFIGKTLTDKQCKIKVLNLDDNSIGSQGLKNLTVGLRQNPKLQKLSLKYCNINTDGAKYIQQILANIDSKLCLLELQGNPFGNQGGYQILRAIYLRGQTLEKINLADIKMDLLQYKDPRIKKKKIKKIDTQQKSNIVQQQYQQQQRQKNLIKYPPTNYQRQLITIQQKIVYQLQQILRNNLVISQYNINFNPMSNDVGQIIMNLVQQNKRIIQIQLPNNIQFQIRDDLDTILRKRKKKGNSKNSPNKSVKNKKK